MFNFIKKILTPQSITHYTSYGDNNLEIILQDQTYRDSLYLKQGLNKIKDAVSNTEFILYKIINSKGEAERIEDHEIISLINKPNPFQTKGELLRIIAVNMKLSGEAFLRVVFDKNKPVGLISIMPKDVQIKIDDGIKYVVNETNGKQSVYNSNEIIHIKDPDPDNIMRGDGVLKTVLSRIVAENNSVIYQNGIFARNGNPDGMLVVKEADSVDTLTKIKRQFINSFTGSNEKNRIAVLSGDVDYKEINSKQSLDYIATQKQIRNDILSALGVPEALITSENVNRANAESAIYLFYYNTINPLLSLIVEALNERFIIQNYGQEYYLDTKQTISEDKELLLKEIDIAVNGVNQILTVDEARQRLGYEPKGSNELNNGSVIIQNAFQKRQDLLKYLKERETLQKKLHFYVLNKTIQSNSFKSTFIKAMDEVRDRGEQIINTGNTLFFAEQEERILKRLNNGETTAEKLFPKGKEKKLSMEYIMPLYSKIANLAGNTSLIPVKAFKKDIAFELSERINKKLKERADLFAESITDTTFETVQDIVVENMQEGIESVSKKIRETFQNISKTRALTIARTEACNIASLATNEAYAQSNVVTSKQWLTTGDSKVREEHVRNNGKIVSKNSVFPNGESYPAEHSINCRCTLAPVVDINQLF